MRKKRVENVIWNKLVVAVGWKGVFDVLLSVTLSLLFLLVCFYLPCGRAVVVVVFIAVSAHNSTISMWYSMKAAKSLRV